MHQTPELVYDISFDGCGLLPSSLEKSRNEIYRILFAHLECELTKHVAILLWRKSVFSALLKVCLWILSCDITPLPHH